MPGVHGEVDALAREALALVARDRVGVVERARLLEVHREAPAAHLHRRDPARVVELLDGADSPVGDVEVSVALPELEPVPDREAPVL
jgi:hypothetical protein